MPHFSAWSMHYDDPEHIGIRKSNFKSQNLKDLGAKLTARVQPPPPITPDGVWGEKNNYQNLSRVSRPVSGGDLVKRYGQLSLAFRPYTYPKIPTLGANLIEY